MASSIHSTTQCRLLQPPAQRANVIQNDLTSHGQNCFPRSGGTPLFSSSPHPNADCFTFLLPPPRPTDSLLQFFESAGAVCVQPFWEEIKSTGHTNLKKSVNLSETDCRKCIIVLESVTFKSNVSYVFVLLKIKSNILHFICKSNVNFWLSKCCVCCWLVFIPLTLFTCIVYISSCALIFFIALKITHSAVFFLFLTKTGSFLALIQHNEKQIMHTKCVIVLLYAFYHSHAATENDRELEVGTIQFHHKQAKWEVF